MSTISRHYKCPKTLIEHTSSLVYMGPHDKRLIEELYQQDVKANPKLEVTWEFEGISLRT